MTQSLIELERLIKAADVIGQIPHANGCPLDDLTKALKSLGLRE